MIALHLKQNEKKKMGSGVKVALRFGSLVGLLRCIAKILERNCIVRWERCGRGEGFIAGDSGRRDVAAVGQPQKKK